MDEFEFYNKHYLKTREDGAITDAWSDGPLRDKPVDGAVCFNDKGGYQLRLILDGEPTEENPPIWTMDGIPLYKWDGHSVHKRTSEEIEADRAKIPPPPPSPIEQLRADMSTVNAAAGIVFVTLAEAGQIDDVTAGEHSDMFSEWAYPVAYSQGQLRRYGDKLYRCVSAHTSEADWTPDRAVSLWTAVADPKEEWPEWSQPVGAHDAYNKGDKVSHDGRHYISDVDANVWEPGVYGWTEE